MYLKKQMLADKVSGNLLQNESILASCHKKEEIEMVHGRGDTGLCSMNSKSCLLLRLENATYYHALYFAFGYCWYY